MRIKTSPPKTPFYLLSIVVFTIVDSITVEPPDESRPRLRWAALWYIVVLVFPPMMIRTFYTFSLSLLCLYCLVALASRITPVTQVASFPVYLVSLRRSMFSCFLLLNRFILFSFSLSIAWLLQIYRHIGVTTCSPRAFCLPFDKHSLDV